MSFLAPLWLLGLVPWVALTAWSLLGRRRRIGVPFLPLWQGPIPTDRPRRGIRVPPIAIIFSLLAVLLSVLAAAQPTVRGADAWAGSPITLIVDRGISMSARGEHDLRFREVFAKATVAMRSRFGSAPVDLVFIPGDQVARTDFDGCKNLINQTAPTAIDTDEMLPATINQRLAQTTGPVIVISDQSLPLTSRRLAEIFPERAAEDVGIARFTAREKPMPQVMVRVRNQSSLSRAGLTVDGGSPIREEIPLPPRGASRDFFINMPAMGEILSAEVQASDDLPANNRAWLVREGSSSKIEVRCALSPELRRLIEVYQKARPGSQASTVIAVVDDMAQLPATVPAVLLARGTETIAPGPIISVPHPVTNHVEWTRLPGLVRMAGAPPDGWMPLVASGGQALVAVGPGLPRQVWVGFDVRDWATTTDFVIFWANVFDWVGGDGQTYASRSIDDWSPQWHSDEPAKSQDGLWPGIFRRSDGAMMAFNCPDRAFEPPPDFDWRKRLSDLPSGARISDVSAPLLAGALACMVLCAMTWHRADQSAQIPETSRPRGHQAYA